MNTHYSDRRKIDPSRGALLGDGTLNDNDRVEIGPTQLAFGEWAQAGLALPNLERMREFRWKRLVKGVVDASSPKAGRIYFLRSLPRDPFADAALPAA